MKFKILPVASLALIAALGFSSLVVAHPGGMGMRMGMGPMGGMAGPRAMMMADPAALVEQHLAEARTVLKITADQEAAWQGFATKARAQAADRQGMRERMWQQQTSGSAPEIMQQRAETMKSMVARMETMSTSLQALYAVLSPEQKALADQQFPMLHGHRMAAGK